MIDIEKEIFTEIAQAVRAIYQDAYVTGEYVRTPPSFPCVSVEEKDNATLRRTQTSAVLENHAVLMYEVNVYSNKEKGKKSECRALINVVDTTFQRLGFTRQMLNPIPNLEDATIYRIIARYKAVVDQSNVIYRR
ncbi:MAG: hypothetical protein Q4E18_02785 [Clostridia bacterium]|nr:hypothetical protein [Clostridia bacterium]